MSMRTDCLFDTALGRVGYGIRWTAFVRLVFLILRSQTSGRDSVKARDLLPLANAVFVSAQAVLAGKSLPILDRISIQFIMLGAMSSMGFFQSRREANLKTLCHLVLQALFLGLSIYLYVTRDSDPSCATQGADLVGIHMPYLDLLASSHVLSWIHVLSLVVLVALGALTRYQARRSRNRTQANRPPQNGPSKAFRLCMKWLCFIVTVAIFGLDMCLVVAGWDGAAQKKFLGLDLMVLLSGLWDLNTQACDGFQKLRTRRPSSEGEIVSYC